MTVYLICGPRSLPPFDHFSLHSLILLCRVGGRDEQITEFDAFHSVPF